MTKHTMRLSLLAVLSISSLIVGVAYAQNQDDAEKLLEQANQHLISGEYKVAIKIYDDILEITPNNISTLQMKGIAQSNLDEHTGSLKQFFKVLQYKSDDIISLVGLGVGFGNLGEYRESITYFEKALAEEPDSVVINNYWDFANAVITKYPYTPTEKPKDPRYSWAAPIPEWIRPVAGWWSAGDISDAEFKSAMEFLLDNKIIQIPPTEMQSQPEKQIPQWVRDNAGMWADRQVADDMFLVAIHHLVEQRVLSILVEPTKSQEDLDYEFYLFERYLRDISNNISKEKRYIEYPNPSRDVIKKFLRDYVKWNLEAATTASTTFPSPTYVLEDGVYIVNYKVFINDQPTNLPLDHVSTLGNSFSFWTGQDLTVNDLPARIEFVVTNQKHEANVWVTWVVRDLCSDELQKKAERAGIEPCKPDQILGHAHLGKGIVEVTLGDYNCDGSFQLYDVKSVESIMTHELGHSIGLQHSDNPTNIMYPTIDQSYAYCLLS